MSVVHAAVELGDLVRVVIAATLAGVTVTTAFSLALLGGTRGIEARRAGRPAWRWTVLGVLGLLATVAAVGLGIYAVAS